MIPFPQPDRDAVAAFVDCLFRYADEKTYINLRAFHDLKDGAPPLFVEPVQIGAADCVDRICERIEQAAAHPQPIVFCPPVCVFAEPNGAATENLAEGVALSVECDSGPYAALKKLTEILGKPTVVVASGGTWLNPETNKLEAKLHLHWRLVEPTRGPADHARLYEARALAAELVGADKTAVALVHPLRWAGSWHRKTDTPRLVRLKARPDVEIELGEALERLREAHAGSAAPKRGNGHDRDEEGRDLMAPLSKLAAAMAVIPNDEATSWEIWNRMGMALWVASSGQGFAIFDAWSLKHSKYDAGTTKARWEHYGKSPPDRIGAGTLFYLADQADPGWHDRYVAAERAKKGAAESEEQALLNALAKKSPFEYEQARAEAAKKLNIRRSALDDLVDALRPPQDRDFLPHWKVEPWSEPVGGVALLGALREQFARYVVLPAHADVALALWTLLTWVFEQFDITPYLSITSPTRRCGKTVLMTLLYWLCRRGKKSDYMSRAAIYRSVENEKPTLVLDEVGWVVDAKDERQGILCGGFERNGYVELAEGEGAAITVRRFSTYCPKAFGLIGKLTTTLTDRAICIPMRRKRPAEKVARLRRRDNDEFAKLRRQCLRWANDNAEALAKAPTAVIEQLHDRAVDAWEPLAVISDHVGGEWPALARAAALALSGEADDNSVNIRLLRDVRWILDGRPVTNETTGDVDREFDPLEKVHSETLVGYLTAIADSPWADWKGAKGFTQNALASRLEDFGIHPRNIRLGGRSKKDTPGSSSKRHSRPTYLLCPR